MSKVRKAAQAANGRPARLTKAEQERIERQVESEHWALMQAKEWAADILPPLAEACDQSMEEFRGVTTGQVPDFTTAEFLSLLRYLGEAASSLKAAAQIIGNAAERGGAS